MTYFLVASYGAAPYDICSCFASGFQGHGVPVDYTKMSDPELLVSCGDNAARWASAFQQIVVARGLPIDDELLTGWFANMIETACGLRARAVDPSPL